MRFRDKKRKRQYYPAFWERAIPILVFIIGVLVLVLVLVAMSVLFGLIPGQS